MTNRLYDRIKFIAQIFLPALGTFYAALAMIWGLPAPEAVVGTISAIDVFLGALLSYFKSKYDRQEREA